MSSQCMKYRSHIWHPGWRTHFALALAQVMHERAEEE